MLTTFCQNSLINFKKSIQVVYNYRPRFIWLHQISLCEFIKIISDVRRQADNFHRTISQRRRFTSQMTFIGLKPDDMPEHIGDQYLCWVGWGCAFVFLTKWWWTPYIVGLQVLFFFSKKICKSSHFMLKNGYHKENYLLRTSKKYFLLSRLCRWNQLLCSRNSDPLCR